eukprot:gene10990-3696_t
MTELELNNTKLFSGFVGKLQEDKDAEIQISVTIMGDKNVGKTSLVSTFLDGSMKKEYIPTVFDRYSTLLRVKNVNQLLDLSIHDTGGNQSGLFPLNSFWNQWIIDSDAIILVYDSNDLESLKSLKKIAKAIENVKSKENHFVNPKTPYFPIVLVGTKTDLIEVETITDKDLLLFAKDNLKVERFNEENPWNFKIDCKNTKKVEEVFQAIFHQAVVYKMRKIEELEVLRRDIGSPPVLSPRGETMTPSPSDEHTKAKKNSPGENTTTRQRRKSLSEVLLGSFFSHSSDKDNDEVDFFNSIKHQ